MSDTCRLGLVDFVVGLLQSVLLLSNVQVKFLGENYEQIQFIEMLLEKTFSGAF